MVTGWSRAKYNISNITVNKETSIYDLQSLNASPSPHELLIVRAVSLDFFWSHTLSLERLQNRGIIVATTTDRNSHGLIGRRR